MSDSFSEHLYRICVEDLEMMCGVFPAEQWSDSQRQAPFEAGVEVGFQGPREGRLLLTVHGGLMDGLTSSLLGASGSSSEDQKRDALGEFLNVVVGNFLPYLEGPKAVYKIHPPQAVNRSALENPARARPSARAVIPVDSGRIELLLFTENGVKGGA